MKKTFAAIPLVLASALMIAQVRTIPESIIPTKPVAAEPATGPGHIPRCWVINCRDKRGAACERCVSLNCGAQELNDNYLTIWCNR